MDALFVIQYESIVESISTDVFVDKRRDLQIELM